MKNEDLDKKEIRTIYMNTHFQSREVFYFNQSLFYLAEERIILFPKHPLIYSRSQRKAK